MRISIQIASMKWLIWDEISWWCGSLGDSVVDVVDDVAGDDDDDDEGEDDDEDDNDVVDDDNVTLFIALVWLDVTYCWVEVVNVDVDSAIFIYDYFKVWTQTFKI